MLNFLICVSRIFPPTEQDLKGGETQDEAQTTDQASEKERTESGDETENETEKPGTGGSGETQRGGIARDRSKHHATVGDFPEVPETEPSTGDEPAPKRQRSSD
jgi:hypothetical protein